MSIIYNIITFMGNQKRELKKANLYNSQENNRLKVSLSRDNRLSCEELTKDQIKNLKLDEQLRLTRLSLRQEQSKGNVFLLFSLVSSVISAMFSICGLNGVINIKDCIKDVPSTMITSVFAFFSLLNMVISYYETYHSQNYYQEQNKLKIFQTIFIATSIVSNYIFLRMQGINIALAAVLSSLLDMSGMYCGNIANAKKYKNKTSAKTANNQESITYMITQILSSKLRNPIEKIYERTCKIYQKPDTKKTCKIVSNVGNTDFFEGDEMCKINNYKCESQGKLVRTSASKITKEKLYELIKDCQAGEIVTPKKVNMQGSKNFYNWLDKCELVKKVDGKYVKVG